MPNRLDEILETTRATLPALRRHRREIERQAHLSPDPPRLFPTQLTAKIALIAEVKRRSPSVGAIADALDPVAHALAYAAAGASAISVLTDGPFFGGSLEDLQQVAARVEIPVLRKDFILDETQIAEARAFGASAILLIVRAMVPLRLRQLAAVAADWKLDVLVEAHDAKEVESALESGVRFVGINARNLDSFTLDTEAAWKLFSLVPPDRVAVAESGMSNANDVERAAAAGADAVLIGTALSASPDPKTLAQQCASVPRRGR